MRGKRFGELGNRDIKHPGTRFLATKELLSPSEDSQGPRSQDATTSITGLLVSGTLVYVDFMCSGWYLTCDLLLGFLLHVATSEKVTAPLRIA